MSETRPQGGQVGNLNAVRHGRYAHNLTAINRRLDKRSALYKRIQRRVRELRKALGRELSPQKEWLITDIARTEALLDGVDVYLNQLASPISKGRPRPALAVRLELARHIRDGLMKLGLDRVKRKRGPFDWNPE